MEHFSIIHIMRFTALIFAHFIQSHSTQKGLFQLIEYSLIIRSAICLAGLVNIVEHPTAKESGISLRSWWRVKGLSKSTIMCPHVS